MTEVTITFEPENNRTILPMDFMDVRTAGDAVMMIDGEEHEIPDILRLWLDELASEKIDQELGA